MKTSVFLLSYHTIRSQSNKDRWTRCLTGCCFFCWIEYHRRLL